MLSQKSSAQPFPLWEMVQGVRFRSFRIAIGLFTPPVGVNLYVACGVANVNLKQISKAVVPLLVAALIVLLIITYIPGISTLFT